MEKIQTLQLLISTMHQTDYSLLDKMNVNSDAVVVNQCNENGVETVEYKGHKICWVNTTQRGLSKSRNMALSYATAQICVISDDDMIYNNDYSQTVINAFSQEPGASLIRFQVRGIEKPFRQYQKDRKKLGYLSSMAAASVEIAFKREEILEKQIKFDELIGAGTQFLMGEENSFIFHCLKKGLVFVYVPCVIADLHIGNSTWFSGFNEKYLIGRGAAFTSMDKKCSILLMLQWALRKYNCYRKETSFFGAMKLMLKGRKIYLSRGEENDT